MSTLSLKLQAVRQSPAWQLVLDKFPFAGGIPPALSEKKLDALKPLANSQRVKAQWEAAIKSKATWLDSLEKQHTNRLRRIPLVNSSRLLLHLGRASVLENVGLYCERTTGLPLIPGSAVKGVVSTWACWEGNGNAIYPLNDREEIHLEKVRARFSTHALKILGDNSENGSTAAGVVVFLGAFPTEVPKLELDIVTPHTDASGRDHDPVPNPFLAVAPGTPWHFSMLVSPRHTPLEAESLLQTAQDWLTEALEQSGLGAKTASDYGRFIDEPRWQAATLSADEQTQKAAAARRETEKAATLAAMKAARIGDYDNETIFKNQVLARLDPSQINRLEPEIGKLRKEENAPWRNKLIEALKGREMRDLRKKLKEKTWFPQDWLPS